MTVGVVVSLLKIPYIRIHVLFWPTLKSCQKTGGVHKKYGCFTLTVQMVYIESVERRVVYTKRRVVYTNRTGVEHKQYRCFTQKVLKDGWCTQKDGWCTQTVSKDGRCAHCGMHSFAYLDGCCDALSSTTVHTHTHTHTHTQF